MKSKGFLISSAWILVLVLSSNALAESSPPYLIDTSWQQCKHGLTEQPDGGPFSVYVFCDDALGSNIGVINTEPAAGPGSIILTGSKRWIWTTDDRFWQDSVWASDVTSFAWSPDRTKLIVATSYIYGSGGLFELDLVTKKMRQIAPKDRTVTTSSSGPGFLLTRIDIKKGELYYTSRKHESRHEEALQLESICNIDLGHWLDCNNPLVIEYLGSLSDEDIGKEVAGVRLSDGRAELKGLRFVGSSNALGINAHIFVFTHSSKQVSSDGSIAYIWVDDNGKPFKLPECENEPHVLSGDVYTWNSVQRGHGVVSTTCVPQSWLDAVGHTQ